MMIILSKISIFRTVSTRDYLMNNGYDVVEYGKEYTDQ